MGRARAAIHAEWEPDALSHAPLFVSINHGGDVSTRAARHMQGFGSNIPEQETEQTRSVLADYMRDPKEAGYDEY